MPEFEQELSRFYLLLVILGGINKMVYDVTVIGAGVIGCHIARQLSRYKLKICLLEKQSDVATGTSAANSGIIHAGYDVNRGNKARFNIRGNRMMDKVARELDIPSKGALWFLLLIKMIWKS